MLEILHDSHDRFYRTPFGAVPCKTDIELRIDLFVKEADDINCYLQIYEGFDPIRIEMSPEKAELQKTTYTARYKTPDHPGLVWYYFVIRYHEKILYYGNNWGRSGGKGVITDGDNTPSYQITVYDDKKLSVPEWYKKSIMYQIFVDRFCNGNEDKKVNAPNRGSLIHGNWDDTPYYIKDREGRVVRWDFFGGNVKGVEKKLPYLKELGIGVIYLNPIFEAISNHKYDTGDYKKIDPMFGSLTDFESLIKTGEQYGIRFILDGVFSHTGSDSLYFNKSGTYPGTGAYQSKESPHFSWYKFSNYPEEYESWWGVGTLPNVNEMESSYQDYIYRNKDSVIKYWIQKGVKGWRLDVADELPDEFIKGLKRSAREADDSSVLIGEVWEDASNKVSYDQLRQYLWGDELDSVMNYPFRSILIDYILGHIDGDDAEKKLMSLYENYPQEIFYSNINLIGTHDVERILTLLGEARNPHNMSDVEKEKYRLPEKKRQTGIRRLKLLVLIQMTFPGIPCIYYGDEAGMEGYADPYNRGPYPWGREDKGLLAWYKKAINIRKNHEVFVSGAWKGFSCHNDIFGYIRTLSNEQAICLFNRSLDKEYSFILPKNTFEKKSLIDLVHKEESIVAEKVSLKPLEGRIFLSND